MVRHAPRQSRGASWYSSGYRGEGVLRVARPERLRQNHDAPLRRRFGAARCRRARDRRQDGELLAAPIREQMRVELKKITRAVGVTTLYVTHDQAEALSLGDRVCVMHGGEILQIAPPDEIYARPATLFVAKFVGEMNFIKGRIAA